MISISKAALIVIIAITAIIAAPFVFGWIIRCRYKRRGFASTFVNTDRAIKNFVDSESESKVLIIKNDTGDNIATFKPINSDLVNAQFKDGRTTKVNNRIDDIRRFLYENIVEFANGDYRIFVDIR